MRHNFYLFIFVVLIVSFKVDGFAFETHTHALITRQAYENSVLRQTGDGSVINRLGLDRLDISTPFNTYWNSYDSAGYTAYYDENSRDTSYRRTPDAFERCQMQVFLQTTAESGFIPSPSQKLFSDTVEKTGSSTLLPFQNWLVRGAIREDDLNGIGYLGAPTTCGTPDKDPYGPILRVVNHFYDPINDIGLSPCPSSLISGLDSCKKSVDWALGFVDSFANPTQVDDNRRNHFTWADARDNFYLAFTDKSASNLGDYADQQATNAQRRLYRWATMFRSLGDVVHLLEDTAQPQHTRNDSHGGPFVNEEQKAFEAYTNARVLRETAENQNAYVRGFFGSNLDNYLPDIQLGSYGTVMFGTPQRFFSTRNAGDGTSTSPNNRHGLADYTNREFFTGGTLPGSSANAYVEPAQTLNYANGYSTVSVPCQALYNADPRLRSVPCVHYTHTVLDTVNPSYQDILPSGFALPKIPLVSGSVFITTIEDFAMDDFDAYDYPYAMGMEEFQTMGNLTIPRAVGYATGLINYFFRGQITISPPPDGLYAILDHGISHSVNAQGYPCLGSNTSDGCPTFGFTQVQMNVQNTTPPITESGTGRVISQALTGGTLVAVARYHRNTCYQPDLSGELGEDANAAALGEWVFVIPPCDLNAGRTPYTEISVSKELSVDEFGNIDSNGQTHNLNGDFPTLALFDFNSDPIPVNATDLFLQVVFRGNMGDTSNANTFEPDGIAVGMMDVSEPTYVAGLNMSDYLVNASTHDNYYWVANSELPVDEAPYYVPKNLVKYQTCLGHHLVSQTGDGSNVSAGIPVAGATRYAAILDPKQTWYSVFTRAFFTPTNNPYYAHYSGWPWSVGVAYNNLNAATGFQARSVQANMENNAISSGFYVLALYNALGVNLGNYYDHFYYFYIPGLHTIDGSVPIDVVYFPAFPDEPSSANVFPSYVADRVDLNNLQSAFCSGQAIEPSTMQ